YLGVHRSDRKVYDLAWSSCLLPCRRSDGVYRLRTVTPAEPTVDLRPTYHKRAQSQHVLIIAEKTCWLPNALSVIGVCPRPSRGRKGRSPEHRPSRPAIGKVWTRSEKGCILCHPVQMAQKNSAGSEYITPVTSCQESQRTDRTRSTSQRAMALAG